MIFVFSLATVADYSFLRLHAGILISLPDDRALRRHIHSVPPQ
jgi:hypothetical protein